MVRGILCYEKCLTFFVSFTKLPFDKSDTDRDRDGDNESLLYVDDLIDNLEQSIVDQTLLTVRFFIHLPEHGSWCTVFDEECLTLFCLIYQTSI
jgi:hypothetical protein